jgi:GTP-binding protein HflX
MVQNSMDDGTKREKALLIGTPKQKTEWEVADSLEELSRLAETAGARVAKTMVQSLKRVDAALLIGKGKAEEVKSFIASQPVDVIIFDDELTPTQQRNLEAVFQTKTIDRTALILDIFAQRAQSREGKLQVELAQLTYTLPRLAGKGVSLSRLGGGIGTRGPGETKLEVDRRRIKERITTLKRELEKVRRVRALHRRDRKERLRSMIALVGYTNSGKSTLLNRLSQTRVPAKDQLFSTLDPKVGRLRLSSSQEVFITDTVGFINKLPHQLIAAFKATLEEVTASDLLIHVIDISSPHCEVQIEAVNRVLAEIEMPQSTVIHAFNKIDLLSERALLQRWESRVEHGVGISAVTGEGVDALCAMIGSLLLPARTRVRLTIPFEAWETISRIVTGGTIIATTYADTGVIIEADINRTLVNELKPYIQQESRS